MPLCFARLGVKWMLLVGMFAWVLRYGLFSYAAGDQIVWMILLGVILHGVCYDFFFVTGMIYADKRAPVEIRNQAQGFLVLITQGLGLGIGAKLFAAHVTMNTTDAGQDWESIWLYPAVFAGVVMTIFFLLFWDRVDPGADGGKLAN
jgi:MFS family permease